MATCDLRRREREVCNLQRTALAAFRVARRQFSLNKERAERGPCTERRRRRRERLLRASSVAVGASVRAVVIVHYPRPRVLLLPIRTRLIPVHPPRSIPSGAVYSRLPCITSKRSFFFIYRQRRLRQPGSARAYSSKQSSECISADRVSL